MESSELFYLLPSLIIGGAFVYAAVRRSRRMQHLIRRGATTNGTITAKRDDPKETTSLTYSFHAGAKTYQKFLVVPREIYDRYQMGDTIEVVYNLRNPKMNEPKYKIDLAKNKGKAP